MKKTPVSRSAASNPGPSPDDHLTPKTRHASAQLVQAIEHRALEKKHAVVDLARSLDIHVSHWYRIRKNSALLAHCERPVLVRVARYVEWPLGRIFLAAGILGVDDFDAVMFPENAQRDALTQLKLSPFSAQLSTPLETAAADHRRLMAELYVALQAAAIRSAQR